MKTPHFFILYAVNFSIGKGESISTRIDHDFARAINLHAQNLGGKDIE